MSASLSRKILAFTCALLVMAELPAGVALAALERNTPGEASPSSSQVLENRTNESSDTFDTLISGGALPSGQTVGAIDGTHSVNHSGEFTYSIPIHAPTARHGVQPNISLNYRSGGSLGQIGQGWSLGGLVSVRACGSPFPVPHHEVDADPNFAHGAVEPETLCLNGVPLRRDYSIDDIFGTVRWRTVPDNGVMVTGRVSSDGSISTVFVHDASEIVHKLTAKDDYEFEDNRIRPKRSISSKNVEFRLEESYREEDTSAKVVYELNGVGLLGSIRWGQGPINPSVTTTHRIDFEYEILPTGQNRSAESNFGSTSLTHRRLQKIIVTQGDWRPPGETRDPNYEEPSITYYLDNGPVVSPQTQRILLHGVTLCAREGGVNIPETCMPATRFHYSGATESGLLGPDSVNGTTYRTDPHSRQSTSVNTRRVDLLSSPDLNGDGRSDTVWRAIEVNDNLPQSDPNRVTARLRYWLSDEDGAPIVEHPAGEALTELPTGPLQDRPFLLPMNGSHENVGADELIVYNTPDDDPNSSRGMLWRVGLPYGSSPLGPSKFDWVQTLDLDGDGLLDILGCRQAPFGDPDQDSRIVVRMNEGQYLHMGDEIVVVDEGGAEQKCSPGQHVFVDRHSHGADKNDVTDDGTTILDELRARQIGQAGESNKQIAAVFDKVSASTSTYLPGIFVAMSRRGVPTSFPSEWHDPNAEFVDVKRAKFGMDVDGDGMTETVEVRPIIENLPDQFPQIASMDVHVGVGGGESPVDKIVPPTRMYGLDINGDGGADVIYPHVDFIEDGGDQYREVVQIMSAEAFTTYRIRIATPAGEKSYRYRAQGSPLNGEIRNGLLEDIEDDPSGWFIAYPVSSDRIVFDLCGDCDIDLEPEDLDIIAKLEGNFHRLSGAPHWRAVLAYGPDFPIVEDEVSDSSGHHFRYGTLGVLLGSYGDFWYDGKKGHPFQIRNEVATVEINRLLATEHQTAGIHSFTVGDYNGDGAADLGFVELGDSRGEIKIGRTLRDRSRSANGPSDVWGKGPVPDLLISVVDGLGHTVGVEYEPLTNDAVSIHAPEASALPDPTPIAECSGPEQRIRCVHSTRSVVWQLHVRSAPTNQSTTHSRTVYRYGRARRDRLGSTKTFLGFDEIRKRFYTDGEVVGAEFIELGRGDLEDNAAYRIVSGVHPEVVPNEYLTAGMPTRIVQIGSHHDGASWRTVLHDTRTQYKTLTSRQRFRSVGGQVFGGGVVRIYPESITASEFELPTIGFDEAELLSQIATIDSGSTVPMSTRIHRIDAIDPHGRPLVVQSDLLLGNDDVPYESSTFTNTPTPRPVDFDRGHLASLEQHVKTTRRMSGTAVDVHETTTRFEYSEDGNLEKIVRNLGHDAHESTLTLEYDELTQQPTKTKAVWKSLNKSGTATLRETNSDFSGYSGSYHASSSTLMTNAVGHQSTTVTEPFFGNVTKRNFEDEPTELRNWDAFGRLARIRIVDGGDEDSVDIGATRDVSRWAPLVDSPEETVYGVHEWSSAGGETWTDYDSSNRPLRTLVRSLGGKFVANAYRYDTAGRLIARSAPVFQYLGEWPGDSSVAWTEIERDDRGRPTRIVRPGNQLSTTIEYNRKGFLNQVVKTDDGRPPEKFVYGPEGLLYAQMDRVGTWVCFEYNAQRRLARSWILGDKDPSDDPGEDQDCGFGTGGMNPGDAEAGERNFEYDVNGNPFSIMTPERGIEYSWYDGAGFLVRYQDAKGEISSRDYDALGRVKSTTSPAPLGETTFVWDDLVLDEDPMVDRFPGKLLEIDNSESNIAYRYDEYGRATGKSVTIDSVEYDMDWKFDAVGRTSRLLYPRVESTSGRFGIDYRYDPGSGRLAAVGRLDEQFSDENLTYHVQNGRMFWVLSEVDERGRATKAEYGNLSAGSGHDLHERIYDPITGRLRSSTAHNVPKGHIQKFEYQYYPTGMLEYIEDQLRSVRQRETFTYDGLDQLTSRTVGSWYYPTKSTNYSYDKFGNLLSRTGVDGIEYGVQNSNPRALMRAQGIDYFYDPRGNLTHRSDGLSIEYDARSLPVLFSGPDGDFSIGYDPNGMRSARRDVVAGETRHYVEGFFERIINSTDDVDTRKYKITADGQQVAQVVFEGDDLEPVVQEYLHRDGTGRHLVVTDKDWFPDLDLDIEAGNVFTYSPYGEQRSLDWFSEESFDNFTETDVGYTGHRNTQDYGLTFMGSRMYDPLVGRFVSPDRIVPRPDTATGWNLYAYANNSPVNFYDPSGFCPQSNSQVDIGMGGNGFCVSVEVSDGGSYWGGGAHGGGYVRTGPSRWRQRKLEREQARAREKLRKKIEYNGGYRRVDKVPASNLAPGTEMGSGAGGGFTVGETTVDVLEGSQPLGQGDYRGAIDLQAVGSGVAVRGEAIGGLAAIYAALPAGIVAVYATVTACAAAPFVCVSGMMAANEVSLAEAGMYAGGTALAAKATRGTFSSGGRWIWGSKAIPEEAAEAAYAAIRASTTDVAAISRYTGYGAKRIQAIKDYLFNNPEWTGADEFIAAAWHRLRTGGGTATDRLLLKHETAEMWLRRNLGLDSRAAHGRASEHWNWQKAIGQ